MSTGSNTKQGALDWLSAWVQQIQSLSALKTNLSEFDPETALAIVNATSLLRLTSDTSMAILLEKEYRKIEERKGSGSAKILIRKFLVESAGVCNFYNNPKTAKVFQPKPNRSDQVRDLLSTAKQIEKIANQLASMSKILGAALSIDYLSARSKETNDSLFILKRKGYSEFKSKANSGIDKYMMALSRDLREEAAIQQLAILRQRQTGGKLSALHPVIDMVSVAAARISKPINSALVAEVINTLLSPAEPVDPSTVRKRSA